jgi:hypothetical protein
MAGNDSKFSVKYEMNDLMPSLNTQTNSLNAYLTNEINKVYIELDDYGNDDTKKIHFNKENII